MSKMFSGKPSEHFWEHLKKAKNLGDIKDVIYVLGCLLQEYEDQMKDSAEENDLLKKLKNAEDNRDRFQEHLDKIAFTLDIDWWDGDFPIEEVISKIKSLSNG